MSRGAMNKDVKYYCTGCQEKEQELAELKALVSELMDADDRWQREDVSAYRPFIDAFEKLKQVVTLATDSKEE